IPGMSKEEMQEIISKHITGGQLAMIYLETPANPTNALVDIEVCREVGDIYQSEERDVIVVVDNTYMGPIWQHPLQHGADLVIYSATKYIGGHSDLIAGAVLGRQSLMTRVKTLRTFLGNMAGPWTGWLLMRSLETLKVRMEQQTKNAQEIAIFLNGHPKVKKVFYLGLLQPEDPQYKIYKKQYSAPGAMLSFEVKGNEEEAFRFLNKLKLIRLAVSLGGTESLAEHPANM